MPGEGTAGLTPGPEEFAMDIEPAAHAPAALVTLLERLLPAEDVAPLSAPAAFGFEGTEEAIPPPGGAAVAGELAADEEAFRIHSGPKCIELELDIFVAVSCLPGDTLAPC